MAYNNGREDRKWRIWKEAEEKVLREHGVDEATIEQIRIDDRADFNSNRRFYHWTSDFGEYLEGMADREQSAEVKTVEDLLDEIEDENLYQALLTVDRRTLQALFSLIYHILLNTRYTLANENHHFQIVFLQHSFSVIHF